MPRGDYVLRRLEPVAGVVQEPGAKIQISRSVAYWHPRKAAGLRCPNREIAIAVISNRYKTATI